MTNSQADPNETAQKLYEDLQFNAQGNKQRLGTLHRLKQACDALSAKQKPFSLKDIETYCKITFEKGPNAQTISNDTGLRSYVSARKNELDVSTRKKSRYPLDNDIEEIPDIDLRSRMRILAESNRTLEKKLRIITNALMKLNPPLDLDAMFRGDPVTNFKSQSKLANPITPDQIDALARIVATLQDHERLRRAGLEISDGDVIGRGLRELITTAQDISQLETLLAALR